MRPEVAGSNPASAISSQRADLPGKGGKTGCHERGLHGPRYGRGPSSSRREAPRWCCTRRSIFTSARSTRRCWTSRRA